MLTPAIFTVLLACQSPSVDSAVDSGNPGDPRSWEILQEGLPGVALSIWGTAHDDLWFAGADAGGGPLAMHWDGQSWSDLAPPVSGDLWWVFSSDGQELWFCGEDGLLLRYSRDTGSFTQLETGTDATLFGMWGTAGGPLYVVGGSVTDAWGVLLQIDGDQVTEISGLPAGAGVDEIFFKVWGSAADDLWVVSDHGGVMHSDGQTWSRQLLPDSPRLVTIHGDGPDDIVVVGGSNSAVLYERADQGAWEDKAPSGVGGLNGVFVSRGGRAAAVSMTGAVLERVDGVWGEVELPPAIWEWHAAWIDELGAIYAVGGDFVNLRDGAIFRYGE